MSEENEEKIETEAETETVAETGTNSSSIWGWIRNHGAVIQAISTIVLAFLTGFYVFYMYRMVSNQEKQFRILNAAEIAYDDITFSLKNGTIVFKNMGNLPAKDFRIIWRIIKVEGKEVLEKYPNEIVVLKRNKIYSKQELQIRYRSDFKNNEQFVFLIVAWKYKNQGLEGIRINDMHFLWVVENGKPIGWAIIATLDEVHDEIVERKKKELKMILEHEDND